MLQGLNPKKEAQFTAGLKSRPSLSRSAIKFNCWRSEDRRYKINGNCDEPARRRRSGLQFGAHAAYYVVYCDGADGMILAVHYC